MPAQFLESAYRDKVWMYALWVYARSTTSMAPSAGGARLLRARKYLGWMYKWQSETVVWEEI